MMTEDSALLSELAAALHPLDSAPESLPVRGFKPPGGRWQPRPAAVLIAIVLEPSPRVVLTVRSQAMAAHAGQVALPGGGRTGQEDFPVGTALREAAEEVGIDCTSVEPLGLLDNFDTISSFRISPVVGIVRGPVRLRPCPDEVLEIFCMPLAHVMNCDSYRRHAITRDGFTFEAWSMKSGCRPVWGATAAILQELAERISALQTAQVQV
jgi:8-oxo-dGTP pyrophosphatase MutT (NUDIX family)